MTGEPLTADELAAAEKLAQAIDDPNTYWEERCERAEQAYRDVWEWWQKSRAEVKQLQTQLAAVRGAVFSGIMHYYGMDEADDVDQSEASGITNAIMEYVTPTTEGRLTPGRPRRRGVPMTGEPVTADELAEERN